MRDVTVTCDLCGRKIADESTPFGWAMYDKRYSDGSGPDVLDFHRECLDALASARDERIQKLAGDR
jgi:hypothetical protein